MSDDQITVEINGAHYKTRKGAMIIEVADGAGILIPRFCYHEKLSVAANCRMCLVEVEKAPKPLPACATPVMDGMKVFTRSPLAIRAQRSVMEFLLINHPLDCPICDQGGECELQDVAMGYGRGVSRFNERKRVVTDKNLGPLIATDMTRCIHCTRCVRFGTEIAGMPELGVTGRGENLQIGTFIERSMDSELSGNVIDVCPVGALTSKPFRFNARAWEIQRHPTIAPHDAVGSNVFVHVKQNQVVRVVPRDNEEVNEAWISDRDRFSYAGLYSDERLRTPLVKRAGKWQTADWDTALDAAASGMREVLASRPADLGALASPSSTLEELYLLQKLLRGIGSHNIDHRLRQCDFSGQHAFPVMPLLGRSLVDLERIDAALLIGSDSRREQPLVNHRLRKAVKAGAKVAVINPIDYAFNYEVTHKLIGGPVRMLHALAGVARAAGIRADDLPAALKDCPAGEVHAAMAGSLREADLACVLLGPSALGHPQAGTLAALAARVAEASSATLGYLCEGANAAGAYLAGAVPHRGPGGPRLQAGGLAVDEMLRRRLRCYVLLGIEPEMDCFDSGLALRAMQSAEHVVCLTAFRSPAMDDYADVLLPIAPFAENEGTYVSGEGRWQAFERAVSPFGEARPAWKVLRVLGNLLGVEGFDYVEAAAVSAEVQAIVARGFTSKPDRAVDGGLGRLDENALYRIGDVSIYAVDALVRRSNPLQATLLASGRAIRISPSLAGRLGVSEGDSIVARQDGTSVTLPAGIDEAVPEDCVHLSAGRIESSGLGESFGAIEVEKA